jgi:hypothetical protein
MLGIGWGDNYMKKPVLLYSSAEIHARIKRLFGQPSAGDQRVALVAYVGGEGARYLPHPKGLRLICNPSAGGTDPDTLRQLIKRGASVEISDNLHMKVYWSRNRGCVITSANASSSALGRSGLKEAGIWLPAGTVKINRLIRYAHPRIVQESDLRRLDAQSREHKKNFRENGKKKRSAPDFLRWYSAPHRSTWKVSWTDEVITGTASTVKEQTATEYGRREPRAWIEVGKNRVRRNDWLLSFTFATRGIKSVEWIYVDFVVKIGPKEKRYYRPAWPYQAVQVHPASIYPPPPFQITAQFRKAFSAAVKAYKPDRIKEAKTDMPSVRLIDLIAQELKSR